MKIRSKPVKPIRKELMKNIYIDDEMGLLDIINYFEELGINVNDVSIVVDRCWDNTEVSAAGTYTESDEEYNERLLRYEKKLAEYNKWYDDNKEQIAAEVKKRKEAIIKKKEAILLKAKQVAEKELAKLQKKLDK